MRHRNCNSCNCDASIGHLSSCPVYASHMAELMAHADHVMAYRPQIEDTDVPNTPAFPALSKEDTIRLQGMGVKW